MRVDVGKPLKPDQSDKFVHFLTFLTQEAERHQAGLNVAADGEPRKQIRILEDQPSLGVAPVMTSSRPPEARRNLENRDLR